MSVLESGLVISDSNDEAAFGKWFYNTSLTGFNEE